MTIGIYALYWEEQDLTYIGLSQHIETRYKEHIRDMRKGEHTNYKVQNTYSLYGEPKLVIIEECSVPNLNDREIYWTKELNTLNTKHGLNIIEAGSAGGWGVNNSNSKYTKLQILRVLRLLSAEVYHSNAAIESATGVNTDTISRIFTQGKHTWLKERYPFRYRLMLERAGARIQSANALRASNGKEAKSLEAIYGKEGLSVPILISPEGIEYKVTNIREFAKSHDLNKSGISQVINRKQKSTKGWRLKT
jgi:predicted GIY-YIG superfamily endonuclease